MAAVIRITDLDLPSGIDHISTDYQISDDELFNNIVVESRDDTEHLTQITFDTVLDPTIQYYARTRVRLSTGFTNWGNVDIFTPEDIDQLDADRDIPSVVTLPNIILEDNVDNFPLTAFKIKVDNFNTLTNAEHLSTTYIIDELDGTNVWVSMNNAINKNEIVVNDIMLKPNKIYRIRAMFNSTSLDSSVFATKTISTKMPKYTKLNTVLSEVDSYHDLNVGIYMHNDITSVEWILLGIKKNSSILEYEITTTDVPVNKVVIPNSKLEPSTLYVLKVKSNLDDGYLYEYFRTKDAYSER